MGVAKVCFIPHAENNHWPLALRHRPLAYISTFLVVAKLVAIGALALTPSTAALSTITDARMVQLTNEARVQQGIAPLTVSSKLSQAARMKGEDMLKHQYFAHISPSGVSPWFWMKKTDYAYQVAGENLAIDFYDAEHVVSAWLASPSHKANMLNASYTETGIAVVQGEFEGGTSIIVVHMFGTPISSAAPAVAGTSNATEAAPTTIPPTPVPTIAPSPAPTVAATPTPHPLPKVPRISMAHTPENSDDIASFTIEGSGNDTATLLIGAAQKASVKLPPSGSQTISLASKTLPSGTLTAQAFSQNADGVKSALSNSVSFENPEVPPILPEQYTLLLSPAFDHQYVALSGDTAHEAWQLFSTKKPVTVNSETLTITPAFGIEHNAPGKSFSSSLVRTTRGLMSIILLVLGFLVALNIIIKAHIQHPALIAHASFVIFLATSLLFA